MPRAATKTEDTPSGDVRPDPATMSPEQLREYVAKLERTLGDISTRNKPVTEPEWKDGDKRWVRFPNGPTGQPVTINGVPYVGRKQVDRETYMQVCEFLGRAVRSELARMEVRGNLVAPHLLPNDDIMSRRQPELIANL